MQMTQAASNFAGGEGYPFAFMHRWDIMKDEPKWQEMKYNKGQRFNPVDVAADPFLEGSPSVGQQSEDGSSSAKRPIGHDASKAKACKKSAASSSSAGACFAANLQELSLSKMTQWKVDTDRRSHRDEEPIAIEKLKHEDMLRLDREKLELERERLELQCRADERKREKAEMQRRTEEERILAIYVDSATNPRLRAYYKKLQDDIMSKV
jgi:hypothetical protein